MELKQREITWGDRTE